MRSTYRLIMDPNSNPLNKLPPAQRFQISAYLSLMWTTIFCAAAGAWIWYGELVVAHLLVAAGFIFTDWTFRTANERAQSPATYRDHPNSDGTPRYDDVWGG